MDDSISARLAQFACALRERGGVPADRAAAQALIQDWLGCAVAGLATPVGRIFLDHARAVGQGACTALGHGGVPAEAAALVNGALSHIVEMDDVERASVLHPGTVVIPAALAAAEQAGARGTALLDAVIAGFEVMIRIGAAVGTRHYEHFHNTATCGPFGAAAAAGLLLGLDAPRLTDALGNAGTLAAGLWQFNLDGALTKPLHAGRAAATGVLAAQLAACGLTGATHILEGPRGFFAALAPQGDPQRVLTGLGGGPLAVHAVSLKPHASCRHTHAPIDAALGLRDPLRRAPAA
jgi:2-methylcitrate dehydratase PrpD